MRSFLFIISFLGLIGCSGPACKCNFTDLTPSMQHGNYELDSLRDSVAARQACKNFCQEWKPRSSLENR